MRNAMILCVALIAVTIGVFLQTADHRFINFDDPGYVTENPRVKGGLTGENVAWAFSATAMSNWHPLTWLSHMTDVEMFGLDPRGHHLTNVFFHAASTLLLFFLLAQITGAPWQSLFVAALFALHPLHVESVAWVAERKDVLSGFFWFLTLLLYARYVTRGGTTRYLLALLSFAAGLMAKPMLVTLPVVMLLLDGWPLKRFTWGEAGESATPKSSLAALVKEKIPFFLLATLSSAVTMVAQKQSGAMKTLDAVPLGDRIGNAVIAYVKYIGKMFWPADLAMLYPFPGSIPLWQVSGAFLLLVLFSALAIGYRRRHPYLVTGWLWFLVTLVPVIGIVQVGGQSMADRYTYIPLTGLFIIAGWAVPDLLQGWRHRQAILAILAGVVLTASSAVTWRQVGYWKDNLTLYRHTLDVTIGNYQILNNYGIALAQEGRLDEAIDEYLASLKIDPNRPATHNNLGFAYFRKGMVDHAILQFQMAIALNPDYAEAHNNLGIAYGKKGWIQQATEEISMGMKLQSRGGL
jgi:tetratricopeptide (TPR) repeat protein